MPNAIDITNQRFGLLVAIRPTAKRDSTGSVIWLCHCDCGNTCSHPLRQILQGGYRSCGCRMRTKHGRTRGGKRDPLFITWQAMIQRCYDRNTRSYKRYGGRGITVCERWRHSFANFLADVGERPAGATIDRINNDGSYEPGNVKWSTPKEQANNRSRPRRPSI
jgi:hypothetical protein